MARTLDSQLELAIGKGLRSFCLCVLVTLESGINVIYYHHT